MAQTAAQKASVAATVAKRKAENAAKSTSSVVTPGNGQGGVAGTPTRQQVEANYAAGTASGPSTVNGVPVQQTVVDAQGKPVTDANGNMQYTETPNTQSTVQSAVSVPVTPQKTTTTPTVQPTTVASGSHPDFQDNSDKRLKEIQMNLDKAAKSNPEMFASRDTFNQSFSYNDRSQQQKAVLDSYFNSRRSSTSLAQTQASDLAQTQKTLNTLGIMTGEQLVDRGLSDQEKILLQQSNPELYSQYLKAYDNKSKLAIVNGTGSKDNPFESKIQELLNKVVTVPNLQEQYQSKIDALKPQQTEVLAKKDELKAIEDEMESILADTRKELEGTGATDSYIRALASKRQEEILPTYKAKLREYNALADQYNTASANVDREISLAKDQYTMEQQAQTQQMQTLGFAMDLMSYQTPQQKEDAAWNQFIKQQDYTNGNINSTDPTIRRKAVEKAVDGVLAEFSGLPIKRSRDQIVQDIQGMVDSGKSLGDAITENLRKPIMDKPEYKTMINEKFGSKNKKSIVTVNGKDYLMDSNGNLTNVDIPADFDIKKGLTGSQASSIILSGGASQLADQMQEGALYNCGDRGQCGERYNDAVGRANGTAVGNDYSSKTKFIDQSITQGEAGMGVVYNFGGQYAKEGHIGVLASGLTTKNGVSGYYVISANARGNEKLSKDFVPEGLIAGSRGGFIPTKIQTTGNSKSYSQDQYNIVKGMDIKNLSKQDISILSSNGLTPNDAYNIKAQQAANGDTPDALKELTGLRKEFNGLQEIKNYNIVKGQYQTVKSQATAATPAGDLSLIFAYMKMLDPNSTVREGEFANAQNAASIPDRIRNQYNKAAEGTRLTAEQRKDFVASAERVYKESASTYNQRLKEYRGYITLGGNPDNLGQPDNAGFSRDGSW